MDPFRQALEAQIGALFLANLEMQVITAQQKAEIERLTKADEEQSAKATAQAQAAPVPSAGEN